MSSSSMGDWGLSNLGQLATPLLSAPKLSAKEEAHFKILDNFEWPLSEESLRRVKLSQLPEDEFGILLLFFHLIYFLFISDRPMAIGMRPEEFEAMRQRLA